MNLKVATEFDLGFNPMHCVSTNVQLKDGQGMLFVCSEGGWCDPGEELFRTKYIKPVWLKMYKIDGTLLWEKEMPEGVLPGIWFCPAIALDMDKDGQDEIYFLNNTGMPFSMLHRKLQRFDAMTGECTGSWPWPMNTFNDRMSLAYRYYIVAGYVHGDPVIVTCQGTYGDMYLQGWNNNMEKRWEIVIKADEFGPKASHVTPVIDINEDGIDELFWGERLISLDDGHEVINLAPDYDGHSDVILPLLDYKTNEWYIYTCREGGEGGGRALEGGTQNRIVTFKVDGTKVWGDREVGHIHTGWAANVLDGYGKICMAMSQHYVPSDSGLNHEIDGVFYYDAFTGEKVEFNLPYPGNEVEPIDMDGDGYHEFICPDGKILDRHFNEVGQLPGGRTRMGKIMDLPGEHVMVQNGSKAQIIVDADAVESEIFKKRYERPYLTFMQKLMASGYNFCGAHVSCGI